MKNLKRLAISIGILFAIGAILPDISYSGVKKAGVSSPARIKEVRVTRSVTRVRPEVSTTTTVIPVESKTIKVYVPKPRPTALPPAPFEQPN